MAEIFVRTAEPFDFDRIEDWGPALKAEVSDLLPSDVAEIISAANPRFIEDARNELFKVVDRDVIIARVSSWIEVGPVVAYHGSRLNPEEIEAVRREGLKPLIAAPRVDRLRRVLSSHPDWPQKASKLDDMVRSLGPIDRWGKREGKVHLTVSLAGLMRSFNHYLTYGSEFDLMVAQHLLGPEGKTLLAASGNATIFRLFVPGNIAEAACNPYRWQNTGLPSLVREILEVWGYWLAHPNYRSESRELDCGMMFRETLPAGWIDSVIIVDDAELSPERLG